MKDFKYPDTGSEVMSPDGNGNGNHASNGHLTPRGIAVAIGGNEDKENDLDILRATLAATGKPTPSIALITSASSVPEELAAMYLRAFDMIGVGEVHVLHIGERSQAMDPENLTQVGKADVIFFTGGDQLRITSILGGTPLLQEVSHRYFEEEIVVAGTSAGASALSETMIYEGESSEALRKGAVRMTSGIGLLQNVVIDSHFIRRGRFSRLMTTVTEHPGIIGLGLGEDTGVIVRDGHLLEAIGNGLIVVFDGCRIDHSNISDVQMGDAIAVKNVTVHTLVKGYGYDLVTREYLNPSPPSPPSADTGC
jgi:cyanophycinase